MTGIVMQFGADPTRLHPFSNPFEAVLIDAGQQVMVTFKNQRMLIFVPVDVPPLGQIVLYPYQIVQGQIIEGHVKEEGISKIGGDECVGEQSVDWRTDVMVFDEGQ